MGFNNIKNGVHLEYGEGYDGWKKIKKVFW